jgi:hypothetical protein
MSSERPYSWSAVLFAAGVYAAISIVGLLWPGSTYTLESHWSGFLTFISVPIAYGVYKRPQRDPDDATTFEDPDWITHAIAVTSLYSPIYAVFALLPWAVVVELAQSAGLLGPLGPRSHVSSLTTAALLYLPAVVTRIPFSKRHRRPRSQ